MVRRCLLVVSVLVGGFTVLSGSARAGSVTTESVFSLQATRQDALNQVPSGARVTRTVCEELDVRNETRYRCTVTFTEASDAPASPTP